MIELTNIFSDWKKNLQIIEIVCIFVGIVPLSLLLVVSFVTIITRKIVLAAVFRALAIIMTIIASEYVRCEKKPFKNIGVGGM